MRHRNIGRKFGRTSSHRKALMMNLCLALIEHELIKTTLPKAKELRRFIEPMITTSKDDSLAARRHAFDHLRSRDAVTKLFNQIGPRYETRAGGYTRIIKCGYREGDNAPMAIIELVDRDIKIEPKTPAKKEVKVKEKSPKTEKPKKPKAAVEAKKKPKAVVTKKPAAKAKTTTKAKAASKKSEV